MAAVLNHSVTRSLNDAEMQRLADYMQALHEENNPPRVWPPITAMIIITGLSALQIYYYDASNWSLIGKFLVCLCPIVIWVLIENRNKALKKNKQQLATLKKIMEAQAIQVIEVTATRILEFEEKEDEGILYLIEETNGSCFYLWDDQYMIPQHFFPCSRFDIYTDDMVRVVMSQKIYAY